MERRERIFADEYNDYQEHYFGKEIGEKKTKNKKHTKNIRGRFFPPWPQGESPSPRPDSKRTFSHFAFIVYN